MNHSKAFWAVRNRYADEMRGLWSRRYTGEGLWGRGTLLETGAFEANTVLADDALPEHLCGGTYRSRGGKRKRKPKPQLSYREQKERRILKKFGANGVALGEDEEIKTELERGKRAKGKPRVAASKRGRELRAAAALARFGQLQQQKEEKEEEEEEEKTAGVKEEDGTASDSGSEAVSDYDDESGPSIVDKEGRRLIKVCEDENPEDGDAQNEMRELVSASQVKRERSPSPAIVKSEADNEALLLHHLEPGLSSREPRPRGTVKYSTTTTSTTTRLPAPAKPGAEAETKAETRAAPRECPICSFRNGFESLICETCSHVLAPGKVSFWRCKSDACKGSAYLNPGDSGVCGVCGERKGQGGMMMSSERLG